MHKASGGSFAGKYIRDMRRATCLDSSSTAWGLNKEGEDPGYLNDLKKGFVDAMKEKKSLFATS